MKRIHKGDEVIVTTGRSKGQRGHVLRVVSDEKVLVENVNMVKKHQKPNPGMNQGGGIIEKESRPRVVQVARRRKESADFQVDRRSRRYLRIFRCPDYRHITKRPWCRN